VNVSLLFSGTAEQDVQTTNLEISLKATRLTYVFIYNTSVKRNTLQDDTCRHGV
jgi:hypothetical protein